MNQYKWCNVRYGSEPGKGDNIRWLTPSGLGAGDTIANMGSSCHGEVGRIVQEHNGVVDELLVMLKRYENVLIEIRDDPTSDIEGTRAYAARILAGMLP